MDSERRRDAAATFFCLVIVYLLFVLFLSFMIAKAFLLPETFVGICFIWITVEFIFIVLLLFWKGLKVVYKALRNSRERMQQGHSNI